MGYKKSGYRSAFLSSQGASLSLEKTRCKQILEHIRKLERSGRSLQRLRLHLGNHLSNLFSTQIPEYRQRIIVSESRQQLVKSLAPFVHKRDCETELMEFYHYIKDVK